MSLDLGLPGPGPASHATRDVPALADVAILGAGCAGLSLAVRLAGTEVSVVLIEPRETYVTDRTWSCWRMAPHPFEHCVTHRWPRWRVAEGGRSVIREGQGYAYEMVDGGRFYASALATIAAAPNITLLTGAAAEPAPGGAGPVGLRLSGRGPGELSARRVVDTRPLPGRPRYGQAFEGLEIETSRDRFDPGICDLMDFAPPRQDGVAFTYVLPTTPRRALVEATLFSAEPPHDGALSRACAEAAREAAGGAFRVIRQEHGAIPMDADFVDRTSDPRILPFGTRGGAARPATGYAFARIQARADALAAVLTGAPETLPEDGPVARLMDRFFLKVIAREPEVAPDLFYSLFARTSPDRLERFLSGSTSATDRLSVAAALPWGPFLRALAAR